MAATVSLSPVSSVPSSAAPPLRPAAVSPAPETAERWPLVVVGAGAAGLFAASFAAREGCRTLVLDGRPRPGAKIRVSGGGRCNVMPDAADAGDFVTSTAANAMRRVLASWPLAEVRDYFERHLGVPLKREATGKLFPVSDRSRDVVEALLADLSASGATLRGGVAVRRVAHRPGAPWPYTLVLADGSCVLARAVVLATGGLSMPKTGSDGSGWALARGLGHTTTPTAPALVPLLGADGAAPCALADLAQLAGVSLPVALEARPRGGGARLGRCVGDFLFTHRGYSGPSVLNVSRHFTQAAPGEVTLHAQFVYPSLPREQAQATLSAALAGARTASVAQVLRACVPRRLADALAASVGIEEAHAVRASELVRPVRRALMQACTDACLPVSGDEGYKTAEVTLGGVPLAEVHAHDLRSRRVAGLYFAGEVLDVAGRLGGFNFLWAWVSGRLAGSAAARTLAAADGGASLVIRRAVR